MKIINALLFAIVFPPNTCLAQNFDPEPYIQQANSVVSGATQFLTNPLVSVATIGAVQAGSTAAISPEISPTSTSSPNSGTTSTSSSTSATISTSTSSSSSSTLSTSTSSSSTSSTSKSSSSTPSTSKSSSSTSSTSTSSSSTASASTSPTTTASPGLQPSAKIGIGLGVPLGVAALALIGFLALRHQRHKQVSRLQHQGNLAAAGLEPVDGNGDPPGGEHNDGSVLGAEDRSDPHGREKTGVHEIDGVEIPPYSRELIGSPGVRRYEVPTRQHSVYR